MQKQINTTVFEQYEFKGWLITIENYHDQNTLTGFATPTKFAHLLDYDGRYMSNDILRENGIDISDDEYDCIYCDPDDYNTTHSSMMLEWLVEDIIRIEDFDYKGPIVLKQIQKKTITPKVGKRKSGFIHQAWAAMVKKRDKKCTQCSSVFDLHAHHIKQYKSHPELRNDVNNGITLCGNCHRKWHFENGR
jgi:hypothetical protein